MTLALDNLEAVLNSADMGLADATRLAIPALMFEVEAIAADRDGCLPSCDKV